MMLPMQKDMLAGAYRLHRNNQTQRIWREGWMRLRRLAGTRPHLQKRVGTIYTCPSTEIMLEEIALAISSREEGVGIVSSFSIWAVSSAVALAVTSVASGCIFLAPILIYHITPILLGQCNVKID